MIRTKTVFVVGAGASNEALLPLGADLRADIARRLDLRFGSSGASSGDMKLWAMLEEHARDARNEFRQAAIQIRDGMVLAPSIDEYIDKHNHDERIAMCGKCAITRAILAAEHRSRLYVGPNKTMEFSTLDPTWYPQFARLLADGVSFQNRKRIFENVVVVTFNYDRCIEQFLSHALARIYNIKVQDARDLVRALPILRPYGSVGDYFDGPVSEFGYDDHVRLVDAISRIRTYTERVEDDRCTSQIRDAIANADNVIFLGNAYHPNNMGLLADGTRHGQQRMFFTRKGIHHDDLPMVHLALSRIRGEPSENPDPRNFMAETCAELFDRHKLRLQAL